MYNVNPGIMASIAGGGPAATTNKLIDILTRLGLTGSLNVCLDAGDSASYPGTGQTWFDRSGSGNDYFLGSTNAVLADDPVFTGSAGDLSSSTYFQADGTSDHFIETTAQTYADAWHQNNGAMTTIALMYLVDNTGTRSIWSNGQGTGGDAGFNLRLLSGVMNSRHSITTTTNDIPVSTTVYPATTWNFFGQAFDEATPTWRFRTNGTAETVVPLASTDTDPPAVANRIWLGGAGGSGPVIGDRIILFAQWSRALSDSEMASIYTQLKLRIPSIP